MITIEIAALCAVITLALALGGIAVRNAIWNSRNEASAKAAKAIAEEAKKSAMDAHLLAAQVSRDLADYRERVARDYATVQFIDRLEEKLVKAIDRLGDRFDNFLTKNAEGGK